MKQFEKVHIGDGAYVSCDGYHIKITAENGIEATDTVYFEDWVLDAFIEKLKGEGILTFTL